MLRLATQPLAPGRGLLSSRLLLDDGASTTLHVARFDRRAVAARVVRLPPQRPLRGWCAELAVRDAIVGGFFVRPEGTPLGQLRIAGEELPSVPFDRPWDSVRSCVHIDGRELSIARRQALALAPAGDLLQAGPLLVEGGVGRIAPGADPEGFSAGARQFDSDITAGRYPRAALAIAGGDLLAVVCDGRADDEAGLTLGELADALLDLGAVDAINLDGGGSASLVFDGRLRNHPREEHGVPILTGRPIATAIAFENF